MTVFEEGKELGPKSERDRSMRSVAFPTSGGNSLRPTVILFSRAALWALVKFDVDVPISILAGSMPLSLGSRYVIRCFILLSPSIVSDRPSTYVHT